MAVTSSGNGDWSSVISGGLSVNDDVIINHDVTLDGNATAVNSLVINSGKTLTGGGNTITIDSRDSATGLSIDINGSTSGELNINITNNLNNDVGIGTDKVHDLTINNDTDARINYFAEDTAITGNLTITRGILNAFNRTLEVDGDCSIAADGKLEANVNGGKNVTLGSLTIASGGTYNATRETTTITNNTPSGQFAITNSGTFTHNKGTVAITGPTDQHSTLVGLKTATRSSPLYNLTINNSGSVNTNLSGAMDIEGDLTVTDGSYLLGGQGPLVVHGLTNIGANGLFGDTSDSAITLHGLVTNLGTMVTCSGTQNYNGGVRNLGTFTSNDTLTIGGTGGILEGNLDDAIINVNTDPVYGNFDGSGKVYSAGNDFDDIFAGNGGCISFWAKINSSGATCSLVDTTVDTGSTGYHFYYNGGNDRLYFDVQRATTDGQWYSPVIVGEGVWNHYAIFYDSDDAGNNPVIYLNGVALTLVESSTPVGAFSSDASDSIHFFNNANAYVMDLKVYKAVAVTATNVAKMASKINVDKDAPDMPTSGIQLWWKGNASKTADSSGESNTLSETGVGSIVYDAFSVYVQDYTTTTDGTFTVTQGKLEGLSLSSVHLDGTADYITCGTASSLRQTDTMTFSMWINADTLDDYETLFCNEKSAGSGSGDGYRFWIMANGALTLRLNEASSATAAAGTITTGKWYHIVGTYDKDAGGSEEQKLYVNGVQVATADYSTAIDHSGTGPTLIGSRANTGTLYTFDGKMRDVRLYDYELSADQVASLYSGSYNVTPLHGWKLDEAAAANAAGDFEDFGTGTDADGEGVSIAVFSNGTLDLDSTLTIAANGTFNGPRGTLQIDDDITGAGTFTLLTGSTFTLASGKTFTGTSTASQLTVDIPDDLDLEIVADVANLDCKSGTDMTVVGAVSGCTFEDSTANIRQWHHTLDTQQLLDADSAGDDDLRLTKPALDNSHELMTG